MIFCKNKKVLDRTLVGSSRFVKVFHGESVVIKRLRLTGLNRHILAAKFGFVYNLN